MGKINLEEHKRLRKISYDKITDLKLLNMDTGNWLLKVWVNIYKQYTDHQMEA